MKGAYLFLCVAVVIFVAAECTSPQKCDEECDKSQCPAQEECACGSYLDRCQCCEFCNKCRGEDCSFVAMDRCEEGYECKHAEKQEGPNAFNVPGQCVEKQQ